MSMFLSWYIWQQLGYWACWLAGKRETAGSYSLMPWNLLVKWGFHSGIWKLSNVREFYLLKIFFGEDFIFFLWTFSMADQEFMQMLDQYKWILTLNLICYDWNIVDDRAQWLTWSWCRCSTNCSKPSREPERCWPSYLLFLVIIFHH